MTLAGHEAHHCPSLAVSTEYQQSTLEIRTQRDECIMHLASLFFSGLASGDFPFCAWLSWFFSSVSAIANVAARMRSLEYKQREAGDGDHSPVCGDWRAAVGSAGTKLCAAVSLPAIMS